MQKWPPPKKTKAVRVCGTEPVVASTCDHQDMAAEHVAKGTKGCWVYMSVQGKDSTDARTWYTWCTYCAVYTVASASSRTLGPPASASSPASVSTWALAVLVFVGAVLSRIGMTVAYTVSLIICASFCCHTHTTCTPHTIDVRV